MANTQFDVYNFYLAAASENWRSSAYQHYKIYLGRVLDSMHHPHHLVFRFECKYGHSSHKTQYRNRLKTSSGTQALLSSAKACNSRQGIIQIKEPTSNHFSSYSEARHRVLIALRCAQSKQSFNSVTDPLYQEEVELLRPGTVLPSPMTVSRDLQTIYACAIDGVKQYFAVCHCFYLMRHTIDLNEL